MDSLIPIILMLLLYLLPEILKKGKKSKSEYEYPDIPDTFPQSPPEQKKVPASSPEVNFDYYIPLPQSAYEEKFFPSIPPKQQPSIVPVVSALEDEKAQTRQDKVSPLQNILSPQIIVNGFIFSEIIMPPRAYRPLDYHRNGKMHH